MTNIARFGKAADAVVGGNTTWRESGQPFSTVIMGDGRTRRIEDCVLEHKIKALLKAEYAIMFEFGIPDERSDDLREILVELVTDL